MFATPAATAGRESRRALVSVSLVPDRLAEDPAAPPGRAPGAQPVVRFIDLAIPNLTVGAGLDESRWTYCSLVAACAGGTMLSVMRVA